MPDPILGHSPGWNAAYVAADPRDDAQRQLVAQLAQPVGAAQTAKQAARVTALRQIIGTIDAPTATRMYQRLTAKSDPLGNLFNLTLHPLTIRSLLSDLDARRRGNDRGTAPSNRGTPPPVPTPPPWVPGPGPQIQWPTWKPRRTPPDAGMDAGPVIDAALTPDAGLSPDAGPRPDAGPNLDAGSGPDAGPGTDAGPGPDAGVGPGSGGGPGTRTSSRNWVWDSLKIAATSLGLGAVMLQGLDVAVLAEAVEAAWLELHFAQAEGGRLTLQQLLGNMGEAAARTVLEDALLPAAGVVTNLNGVAKSFPILDLISPLGMDSVKALGVIGGRDAVATWASAKSAYIGYLLEMIEGTDRVGNAANLIYNNKATLKYAWPRALRFGATPPEITRYIMTEARIAVPADHLTLLRSEGAETLAGRIARDPTLKRNLNLFTKRDIERFARSQMQRFSSIGVTSTDLRIMVETAYKHLPEDVIRQLVDEYNSGRHRPFTTKAQT